MTNFELFTKLKYGEEPSDNEISKMKWDKIVRVK
jgi:hypothetical protein